MSARMPETVPPRIAPLPALPLFHRIAGRKAVVAGGSQGALWKAELLLAAGAEVRVLAGHAAAAKLFEGLAGPIEVLARDWVPGDLYGTALALADLPERAEAERFIAAGRNAGAVVGLIDHAELGDVQFGTIVNRSPVVLAISTDGGAPMLGQSIRTRIEAILPRGLSAWAEAAKGWRPQVKSRFAAFADRRDFWTRFVDRVWAEVDRTPTRADFDALAAAKSEAGGRVVLVGAGPGDPDLLTLKAVRALQAATVILYDDLVGPEVLELARREAVRIAVGKKGHGPAVKQGDINARIVALARAGETVVRLKGGDPLIFGRATEEIEACRAAGVPVSVIPGITAAQGAAAALGFSLTERRAARRVQFVTGHGADGALPRDIDWNAIADDGATTVVYMPRKTLAEFVAAALARGLDPATPAVAVASATLPGHTHAAGCLADIAALARTLPAGAPVIVIIGRVVRDPAALSTVLSEAA